MDEAQRSELRELRRRAYGPRPDLDDAELDRLRELEARQRPDVVDGSSPAGHARPTAGPAEVPDPVVGDDGDLDAEADASAALPLRRRRTTAILWAASVVVAVGATVALSSGLGVGGREVGVVALDPDRAVPSRWDDWYQDAATGVGDFRGLTVIGLVNPEDDAACVAVVAPRPARSGSQAGGCAAGSFPARAVLTVDDDMPSELRDAFTEGTALEFVLEGRSVRVTAG
ncbi:hypothetical protein MT344_01430 [Clavibacter michiganensis subsp. phaseoli]|uniref:hypothetical protein n=1 Tax=Clavibacter phaseoli TaxID=1734031 RepID=UPI001FB50A6A|nr:hypothetical protein [Clavibacter phaseoli]MCJ1709842.1 hypothetical protein [Clavibacter phaseoli]